MTSETNAPPVVIGGDDEDIDPLTGLPRVTTTGTPPADPNTPAGIAWANSQLGQLGAPMSDADRDRLFQYRAKPFLDASTKAQNVLNKQMEAGGLRYSSDRYTGLNKIVGDTWKQVGESVMVPQIEAESANRRADITTAANVGAIEGNLAVANRNATTAEARLALDETNAALARAVAAGEQTGTFVDPVTGESYETMASKAQAWEKELQDRQQSVIELNAAMERATAAGDQTGTYVDPVTGETTETLQSKRDALNVMVQTAIHTGFWDTEATVNMMWLMTDLGIDVSDYMRGVTSGGDTDGGDDPTTALAGLTDAQLRFMRDGARAEFTSLTGLPDSFAATMLNQMGDDTFTGFTNAIKAGQVNTVGALMEWLDKSDDKFSAMFSIADFLTVGNVVAGDPNATTIIWSGVEPVPPGGF